MPQLGFGAFIPPEKTRDAVATALEAGYRSVDTAQMYGNEAEVGAAIAASTIDRSDVFITTKLGNGAHLRDDALRSFEKTLTDLGVDEVDLFLIHWPMPTAYDGDFVSTWRLLEELLADGRARSIGVSNFQTYQLQRLIDGCDVVPAVNQVELHPRFQNREVARFGAEHGIATIAWSPLGEGESLSDPVIGEIAARAGRSPAQVILRWHLDRGIVAIPRSVTAERIRANLDLDFELGPDDLAAIDALDRGEDGRRGPHPDTWAWKPGEPIPEY